MSNTSRVGEGPAHNLVVNAGSSSNAVFVPTNIAASALLHLCTKRLLYSLLISNLLLKIFESSRSPEVPPTGGFREAAIKPSAVCAHFKIIYGRCFVWNVKNRLFNSL